MTNEPNFERNLILAFILSALVFFLFLPFMEKKPAPTKPPSAASAPAGKQGSGATAPSAAAGAGAAAATSPAAGKSGAKTAEAATAARAARAAAMPPTAAAKEQALALDTPVYRIDFSNRGGVARSWILSRYTDNNNHPLNLVDTAFSAAHGYPLEFWTPDAKLTDQLNQALYQMSESHPKPDETAVSFRWSNGVVAATKEFTFSKGYVVNVQAAVTRGGAPVAAQIAWPGDFGDHTVQNPYTAQQYFTDQNSSLTVEAGKKASNGQTTRADYSFAGLEDLYFAAAYLPPASAGPRAVTLLKTSFTPPGASKAVETVGMAFAAGGQGFQLFVGPKEINLLRSINPGLRGLVDFGWFSFLADPLFVWMNWTYAHWIPNYGWVILFITFVITMAMFPFRWKAQKSQIKMAKIQPQIKAINDKMKKYKLNDQRRQELQKEQMALFQEHGINPLGGCLPMLVPVVLIWAFYKVLELAIQLRHAPWIGYIHDLSARDPYYILPIVLVVSQFFTMSLMPMSPGMDQRQMKMMKWVMPTVLGYIFFFFPSGVNLYYLASNVVSVGQQVWINKAFGLTAGGGKPPRTPGSGKKLEAGKPSAAQPKAPVALAGAKSGGGKKMRGKA